MNRDLIEEYAAGGAKLRLAIRGLEREDLMSYPIPGAWSIHQIVLHVMDADLIAADRMKRIIAEENPTLIGFDETLFATELFYEDQSLEDAVTIFDLNRKNFTIVLRKLPDAAFNRIGMHNEAGRVTLGGLVETYVRHLEHHLRFIQEKREILGKSMW